MIDFPEGVKPAELQDRYTREDLVGATNAQIDYMLDLTGDLPDAYVAFVPEDPDADDPWAASEEDVELAWTFGHVILHVTASSEEGVARAASLARGVEVKWRDRYEPDWQTVTTVRQLIERLEESRRIRLAYLEVWPAEPHLDAIYAPNKRALKVFGPMNAVGMALSGLRHEQEHFGQLQEIIRQASESQR